VNSHTKSQAVLTLGDNKDSDANDSDEEKEPELSCGAKEAYEQLGSTDH
jgi:hypothetical protein